MEQPPVLPTPAEILQGAKDRLKGRKAWCQGSLALNKAGEAVEPCDEGAVRWCLAGALQAAAGCPNYGDSRWPAYEEAFYAVDGATGTLRGHKVTMIEWNDRGGRQKAAVLQALTRALAKLDA